MANGINTYDYIHAQLKVFIPDDSERGYLIGFCQGIASRTNKDGFVLLGEAVKMLQDGITYANVLFKLGERQG